MAAVAVLSSLSPTPLVELLPRIGLALIPVQRNDVAAAAEQSAALPTLAGSVPRLIAGDRLLGLLSQTLRNIDRATGHFEDALAACRRAISSKLSMKPLMRRESSQKEILGA